MDEKGERDLNNLKPHRHLPLICHFTDADPV